MFAPESRWAPATLPFSTTATGTSPSRSLSSGSSSSSCITLIAQASPAGPPPTIATPTSIRSSSGIGRRADHVARDRTGAGIRWGTGGMSGRSLARIAWRRSDAQPPFFALIASVSLGTILCRSPTTPRSENSKIGALGSLLIARMFSEFCIPTLCWIAPEIPAAR